ncbi:MAG: Bug family tripartite tricarboxylate transporter substrate binding protein, partial [Lautropia sp.]
WSTAAGAAEWPAKPVRLIGPAPAGSSLDVIARMLSEQLREPWKQPVLVENKAGAGGMIGVGTVAKAPADGLQIAVGFNGPIAFGPYMYRKMNYDPVKDLVPVILTTSQPNVLAVTAGHPARTLREFVDWARQQQGKLNYASVGAGSSSHLTMELFKRAAGFEGTHVAFGGSPPAALSVASGDTQAIFTVAPALLPMVKNDRLRFIATTGASRDPLLPDLPTIAESGYAGFEALAWNGLFVPAGTPAEILARIEADVGTALKLPAVRNALAQQGLQAGGGTRESFARFIAEERDKWSVIIRQANIQLD